MNEILVQYRMPPGTWVYVSALMTIGIYFKFHRLLSVRNLDLIGLIAFSPGLLLITHAGEPDFPPNSESLGYLWVFFVTGFFLVRMFLDQVMVRRPLLEPNLSASGLTFTGCALMAFMTGTVITEPVPEMKEGGPGYAPFYRVAGFTGETPDPKKEDADKQDSQKDDDAKEETGEEEAVQQRPAVVHQATIRGLAILGHLAIVIGLVLIGYRHFDNIHTGVAAASLYLLSPYTAQMTSQVTHVIPGALLVWAVAFYRRPAIAGIFLGLAAGAVFYPLFLLPLWISFYWRRGLVRLLIGLALTLGILVLLLLFASGSFVENLREMFGVGGRAVVLSGFWEYFDSAYRTPVIAAFVAICGSLALWPAQKNLGTLLSCSASVMLMAQFCHPVNGGIYMAWYLPLLILTIFRPNLEDRVALTALSEGWFPWRKPIPGVEGT